MARKCCSTFGKRLNYFLAESWMRTLIPYFNVFTVNKKKPLPDARQETWKPSQELVPHIHPMDFTMHVYKDGHRESSRM